MKISASIALEHIARGKISPGYFLLGKEIYWRDQICEALRKAVVGPAGGMGLAEFDLRQDSLNRVLDKARNRTLLASQQVLIVCNAQGLSLRRRRESEDALHGPVKTSSSSDELAAYFRDPNPDSVVVFEMMDVDLESEDWREKEKVQSRLEALPDFCDVVLLASPGFEEAMELVRKEAEKRDRKISPEACERLVAALDRNMGQIRMELEKLCLYDPEEEEIGVADLDRVRSGSAEISSLSLTEAIGSGDTRKALESLVEIERSGKYAPLVVSEVARYLRQLILLKENRVREPRQAGRVLWSARLSAPQSSLPKLIEQTSRFSGRDLLRGLRLVFQAELALRSSPPDERVVLERFIFELMGPHLQKGRPVTR